MGPSSQILGWKSLGMTPIPGQGHFHYFRLLQPGFGHFQGGQIPKILGKTQKKNREKLGKIPIWRAVVGAELWELPREFSREFSSSSCGKGGFPRPPETPRKEQNSQKFPIFRLQFPRKIHSMAEPSGGSLWNCGGLGLELGAGSQRSPCRNSQIPAETPGPMYRAFYHCILNYLIAFFGSFSFLFLYSWSRGGEGGAEIPWNFGEKRENPGMSLWGDFIGVFTPELPRGVLSTTSLKIERI